MRIYAISDLHLSGGNYKPMDVFGSHWKDHYDTIKDYWQKNITDEDYILHCGDFCWAMKFDDAVDELNEFARLPGKKVLIKGNHDYWWTSLAKMTPCVDKSIIFMQNSSIMLDDDEGKRSVIICGTRGWAVPGSNDYSQHDEKIYRREILRVKLSLESAVKLRQNAKYHDTELIAMLHYPPLAMRFQGAETDTEMNDVLKEYNVNKIVFGHIHKPQQVHSTMFERDSIKYYLTSCDMLNNKPVLIY